MRTKVTVSGNIATIKALGKLGDEINALLEAEIAATVTDIETDAVLAAPVEYGRLRSAIRGESRGLEGEVSVQVDYAPYVEFGTGGLVDVPNGLEDYAIQFKGRGVRQVNLPARPFLFPAFDVESKEMINRIEKQITNL